VIAWGTVSVCMIHARLIEFAISSSPRATVVVIGLRDAPFLLPCLESIAANSGSVPFEVLIVLNDPTERVAASVEREVVGARVSSFRANLGFAAAANFAAGMAAGQYIVLLNDDCLVTQGWLEALIETEQRRPRCGLVTGTFLHPDESLQEAGSVLWSDGSTSAVGDGCRPGYMGFERRLDYASGGCLMIRKDVWDLCQGLDGSYYPAYFEDVDLCLRAAELGWECWYQPRSVVVHARSASTNIQLRGFLWGQAHRTFLRRWSRVLPQREHKGAIEQAVWKAMGQPLRVLVIDDQVPDPSMGSGLGRMYDMLARLDDEPDIHVSFFPRMQGDGPAIPFPIPGVRVISDLEVHLSDEGVDYEVVVVSRPHNVQVFREILTRRLPAAQVIYDAEALYHRRIEMQADLADGDQKADLLARADAMREVETSILEWADQAVCISEPEAVAARRLAVTPVHVVGPRLERVRPTTAPFRDRADIGFVAGWAAGAGSPNCDGLLWFAGEVMPKVRARLPGCRVLVTGFNPPEDVRWLAGSAVEFVGAIRDLASFYNRIRLAISPTRFGAGIKLKTVEAVQFGVPVVCTLEAAAGLPDYFRTGVWVARTADEFAEATVGLLRDQRTWDRQRRMCLDHDSYSEASSGGVALWPSIVRSKVPKTVEAR
jgi:GT2 family glycosyltransferase/glycosyltransferase involved in cell wall biosynthesis